MPVRLKGRVALVTGAARGLGQAFAVRLAQDGAYVVLVDRRDVSQTRCLIEEAGGEAIGFAADVSDEASVAQCRSAVQASELRVDILVNNAGIYPFQPFAEMTFADWREVMGTNLDGTFLISRAFVPGMQAQRWGRVINVTSNTGWRMAPNFSHYVASKLGVVGFTRALASEVGIDGITVNAIAPSLTRTPGTEASPASQIFDTWKDGQAIPRLEVPDDLVGAVSFLASDDAAFITAQTIFVDGGMVRA